MRLSIITVNLNNAEGLERTLASVHRQTAYAEIEHIVIDGASSDRSCDILRKYSPGLKWISEKDSGIYEAMNKGVGMARGEYLLFLNSGDTLYDEDVVSCILPRLNGCPILIGRILFEKSQAVSPTGAKISLLEMYRSFIPHPATFIRKDLLVKRPYDTRLRISADWKFFFETLILDGADYQYLDRIITVYDENGLSSTHGEIGEKEKLQVLKEHFPERVVADCFAFAHGKGYDGSLYDRFFIHMKGFRFGRLLYTLDVAVMKFASLFFKNAKFAKSFPLTLPKEEKGRIDG